MNPRVYACLCLALAGGVAYRVLIGTATPTFREGPTAPLSLKFMDSESPVPALDASPVAQRPIFHASRSFYVAPTPAQMPEVPPQPDYRWVGLIRSPNAPAVALLSHRQTQTSMRVKVGDVLEGWNVKAIDSTRVQLARENHEAQIVSDSASAQSGLIRTASPSASSAPGQSPGGVRVLGAGPAVGASTPKVMATQNMTDSPRLYRPPPQ